MSVTFTCSYDTKVEVDSAAFTVQDVSIAGQTTAEGDLSGGFSISFSNAAASGKFVLGSIQGVHVTWAATTFTATIGFFIEQCALVDADGPMNFIKVSLDKFFTFS